MQHAAVPDLAGTAVTVERDRIEEEDNDSVFGRRSRATSASSLLASGTGGAVEPEGEGRARPTTSTTTTTVRRSSKLFERPPLLGLKELLLLLDEEDERGGGGRDLPGVVEEEKAVEEERGGGGVGARAVARGGGDDGVDGIDDIVRFVCVWKMVLGAYFYRVVVGNDQKQYRRLLGWGWVDVTPAGLLGNGGGGRGGGGGGVLMTTVAVVIDH